MLGVSEGADITRTLRARCCLYYLVVMPSSSELLAELNNLPSDLLENLKNHGFSADRWVQWSADVGASKDGRNRLAKVDPPAPNDVVPLVTQGEGDSDKFLQLGQQALNAGQVALCVLAGGMATRMGGVVKALVEALPSRTFLQLRLGEKAHLERTYGRKMPLWMMTSDATNGPLHKALSAETLDDFLVLFQQNLSLRMTTDGGLFRDDSGHVSIHPTGHGDLPDALRSNGALQRFVQAGGRYVWITNLDNLGATIDPLLLGQHIASNKEATCEVVEKAGDKGGIPVRYNNKLVICEDFRLPVGFDAATVNVFNTNTFLVNATSLLNYQAPWFFCEVEKKVGSKVAIQRERLIGELTFYLDTQYVKVPREGVTSRFLPVKDPDELARRKETIEQVARARGML